MNKLNLNEIKSYWFSQAISHKTSQNASWSDLAVIDMEIEQIDKWIVEGDMVLDIGCANGYSTISYGNRKKINILGLDYIPEMIEYAKINLNEMNSGPSKISFDVGDILNLNDFINHFDKIISTRVLINLRSWNNQKTALQSCANALKTKGLLLLSEATIQGWNNLNCFRKEWGLSIIPEPPFNTYLDERKVIDFLADEMEFLGLNNFSSTYYLGTRVLKPLLIKILGCDIDVGNPDMHWNKWFSQLPAWGDYGTQKLFVFQKK
ncbi:MAG: class I SAM-dependent methyltransferase [Desulfobacteraceae bacterium]|nr:MAG: class I SAM-dependent methyltransferase [Desulfobacteraceae bacterium]